MKGPIARSTLRTSFVLGLRLLVQAGTLLLVARLLGPGQFGTFAGVAALAVLLGALSTFGTHLILLGETSREPQGRQRVLPYAIPCTLLCGSLLLAIYWLACRWWLNAQELPAGVLLLVGGTEMLLQPLLMLMVSEHQALGRIASSQLLQLLPMALRLLAAGLIFAVQPSEPLAVYAAGYAAASMLALFYSASRLPTRWPSWKDWRLPTLNEWRHAFGYAAISITKAGPSELDKTLALRLLPHGAAGVYAAGARVVGAITLPVTAMTLSALPRLFRDGHTPAGGRLLALMYCAASAYSFLLAGALWLSAPAFEHMFGASYAGISDIIRLLCLAIPGMALRLVAGNALMALGKPWMRVGFEMTGLVILTFASVALVGNHGTQAFPLALACAEWSMALIGAGMVLQARLHPHEPTTGI